MITVTLACLNDCSDVLAFGRTAFERSNYADLGYNAVIARKSFKSAISDPAMRVFVAKKDGAVCGLLIGMIDTLPFCAGLTATDLLFAADAGGDKLLAAFLSWCKARKVARIDMAVSQYEDRPAITRLFARHGMQRTGGVFMRQEKPA